MFDITNNINPKRGLSPVAAAAADNTPLVSQILDTQGLYGCMFVILAGTLADADATFTVAVDHGDAANLSDAAAVPADQLNGTTALAGFTFANDDACRKIGYVGPKRYVRVTVTPVNNTGAAPIAGVWITKPLTAPAANPPV